jgi:hypothetical protein
MQGRSETRPQHTARSPGTDGADPVGTTLVTADDLLPTPALLAAVAAERERLERAIEELKHRRVDLAEELQLVDDQLRTATSRHRQLGHVLGEEDAQPALWDPEPREVLAGRTAHDEHDSLLRGAAIRQAAVKAALADPDPGRPRHYREWLDLVESRTSRRVDGRDPGATLLTQISRCPLIVRATEAGTYKLDPAALRRLDARREELHAEAAAQVRASADRDGTAIDLAETLGRIEADLRKVERTIAEANGLVEALDANEFFSGSFAHSTRIVAAI